MEIQEEFSIANKGGECEFAMRAEREAAGLQHSQSTDRAGGVEKRPGAAHPRFDLQLEGRTAEGFGPDSKQIVAHSERVQDNRVILIVHSYICTCI